MRIHDVRGSKAPAIGLFAGVRSRAQNHRLILQTCEHIAAKKIVGTPTYELISATACRLAPGPET